MDIKKRLYHIKKAFSLYQPDTGMGGRQDKSTGSSLVIPWTTRTEDGLTTWHRNSWLCRDAVNKPSMDIAIKWRVFDADDETEDIATALSEAEKYHKVRAKIADCIRQARLYGGALVCMITEGQELTMPMNLRRFKPGDLKNLHIVNRFRATPEEYITDVMNPDYGEPELYHIFEGDSNYKIHSSRVLRMDGLPRSNKTSSYGVGDYRWSESILHAMLEEIERDMAMAQASAHLIQEGSVKKLKVQDLNRRRAGKTEGDEERINLEELLQQISREISIYNTFVLDKDEVEAERMEARVFAGLDKVLQNQMQRVSGSTGIPSTILWGRSPAGMNSTGDSDLTIYQRLLDEIQLRMADPAFLILDQVLAADQGVKVNRILKKMPEYHWPKLMEKNALQEAQASQAVVEGLVALLQNNVISEQDVRRSISGNPSYGEFEGDVPATKLDEEQVTLLQEEVEKLRLAA